MKVIAVNNVPVEASIASEVHSVHGVLYQPEIPLLSDNDLLWMLIKQDIQPFEVFKRTSTGAVLLFQSLKLPSTVTLRWDCVKGHPYISPPWRCRLCQHFGHTNQECGLDALLLPTQKISVTPLQDVPTVMFHTLLLPSTVLCGRRKQ